jgi:threonine/homoserine/homoserine lactone efflux protein
MFGLGSYRTFEILDSGEWVMLGLAAAGLGYLCWYSWRALRGKVPFGLGS